MSSEIRPVTPEKLGDHTLQSKVMEAKGLVERRALQPLRFPKLEMFTYSFLQKPGNSSTDWFVFLF